MEQCTGRLDVAMFNAILRESDDEVPTDPVSDPISDGRVLPIPSGKASFGAGAQLKKTVSKINFTFIIQNIKKKLSKWKSCYTIRTTEHFLVCLFHFIFVGTNVCYSGLTQIGNWSRWLTDLFGSPISFHLLGALSELMMLPKDMLLSNTIRKEVFNFTSQISNLAVLNFDLLLYIQQFNSCYF